MFRSLANKSFKFKVGAAAAFTAVTFPLFQLLTQRDDYSFVNKRRGLAKSGNVDAVGGYSVQGKRDHMEDEWIAEAQWDGGSSGVYGVFDGHGGARCSAIAKRELLDVMQSEAQRGDGTRVDRFFKRVFGELERRYAEQTADARDMYEGSTACVALVRRQSPVSVAVANVGDSRCVLCSYNWLWGRVTALPLSIDHKPDDVGEAMRIEDAGGVVARRAKSSTFRVYDKSGRGGLAMSRALGDLFYASVVPGDQPETKMARLDDQAYALILASDGVWDVMSNAQACGLLRKVVREEAATHEREDELAKFYAKKIVDKALELGTSDNTTAVVVLLGAHKNTANNQNADKQDQEKI